MSREEIHQLTLPLPFRLDHVHSYLIKGKNGWTIIDAGLHTAETKKTWERAFALYNIDPTRDVERIILTHFHPDHFGFSGALQEWTGAKVHMSSVGKARAMETWTTRRYEENRKFYRINGLPESLNRSLGENDRAFFQRVRPFPKTIETIDGPTIQLGDSTYEVIRVAGHAEGHLCFYEPERKLLIGGDHLLEKITPNVSYHGYGDKNPLASFLQSLEKLKRYEVETVFPGHGPIFKDARTRIEQLLEHHRQRLMKIKQWMRGEQTAYQLCEKMFDRELSIHEVRFAMGETIAHLRYLVECGVIEQRIESNGNILYFRG